MSVDLELHSPPHALPSINPSTLLVPLSPTFLYCEIGFHTKMSVHFIPYLSEM